MKNDLLLIEEVERILEMMGVEKNSSKVLLTESIIDDIISYSVKAFTKTGDDAAVVVAKLESDFGVPPGTFTLKNINELLNPATKAVRKSKILGQIISVMDEAGINKISQDFVAKSEDITTFQTKLKSKIKEGLGDGTFIKSDGTIDFDEISELVDNSVNSTVKIGDVNYTKLSDQIKKDIKATFDSDTIIDLRKQADDAKPPVFKQEPVVKGTDLYNQTIKYLETSPFWNQLKPGDKLKLSKKLKNICEANPTKSAKELSIEYSALADKQLNKKPWYQPYKNLKAKYLPDNKFGYYLGLAMDIYLVSLAMGQLGFPVTKSAPAAWETLKQGFNKAWYGTDYDADKIEYAFNNSDWNVDTVESGTEETGGEKIGDEETGTEEAGTEVLYTNDIEGFKKFAEKEGFVWNQTAIFDIGTKTGETQDPTDKTKWNSYEHTGTTFKIK